MESEGLLEEEKRLEKTTSVRNRERGNREEKRKSERSLFARLELYKMRKAQLNYAVIREDFQILVKLKIFYRENKYQACPYISKSLITGILVIC